jgi:RNA polymerase sigma factor (TIGR02999 family)
MPEAPGEVTLLLGQLGRGDAAAADRLAPLIYAELRGIAARSMSQERPDHTLQATALVHEAFLRLAGQRAADWHNRAQFFAVAARVMRRVLLDHARRRHAAKRGCGRKAALDEVAVVTEHNLDQIVMVDECLERLAALDPQQSRIIELHFFTGLTVPEIAHVMGKSPTTIKREWASARAWLLREMTRSADNADGAAPPA